MRINRLNKKQRLALALLMIVLLLIGGATALLLSGSKQDTPQLTVTVDRGDIEHNVMATGG